MSLDQEDWDRLPFSLQPRERAERNELLCALRRAGPGRAVDEDLSGEQRTVFTAVTPHGVPAAALVTALGSNRNAIYKALFEARRILRARLAGHGRDLARLQGAPLTGPPWLDALLAADPGGGITFHVLDRDAEAELTGTGPDSRFPGVAAHLRCCEVCHQDHDGLLAAVEGLRARRVREVTDMRTPTARDGGGPGPLHWSGDHQRPPVVGWGRQMPGPAGTGDH